MNQVKEEMIREFELKKLGYDMMGYTFNNKKQLSYHHLIVAKRNGGQITFQNGAILRQNTSHDYLHRIEFTEPEIFYLITSELIDENIKCMVDIENLKRIRELLLYFESKHRYDRTKNGVLLLKREYITERIDIY